MKIAFFINTVTVGSVLSLQYRPVSALDTTDPNQAFSGYLEAQFQGKLL